VEICKSSFTRPQLKILKELKNNDNIIIKPTDKNFGPAMLHKDTYIKQVFNAQLLIKDYQQLTAEVAKL